MTGATGNVGRHVVDQLVRAGVRVRALTRNPAAANLPHGVEVVQGDLAQPETLMPALEGIERMYLFPLAYLVPVAMSESDYVETTDVVELAKNAGVRRIVVLSSSAVTDGSDTTHLSVEQAVEASGLEWTHVRPGEFALNKRDAWAPSIRAEGVVRSAYPDAWGVPIHEVDIAAVATVALIEDGHAGATYTLTGPEALTLREQVRAIAAGIGREIRFEEVTPEQARDRMIEQGWDASIADYVLEGYQAQSAAGPPTPLPTVEQVTGRPARTLTQWAADHAADFR